MNRTSSQHRAACALVVGTTGTNVQRAMQYFERKRFVTIRADNVVKASERLAVEMPQVILVLVPPKDEQERVMLAERAIAIGALVVNIDPTLDQASFEQLLESTITVANTRHLHREMTIPPEKYNGSDDR